MNRAQKSTLCAVLAVAFFLRLAWLIFANVDLTGFHHDMTWYILAGRMIASGNGFQSFDGSPTAVWPPGYPTFLAMVFLVSGGSLLAAQVAQVLVGTATCFLTHVIGWRLFGPWTGLLAAALLAICPDDIMFSSLLMSEVLFTSVFTGLTLLFVVWSGERDRSGLGRWLFVGILAGVASLIRGTALLFPAVMVAVWLIESRSLRTDVSRIGFILIGMVLALAPWTIRNYVQLGYPIVVGSQIGQVLTVAHSPIATGGLSLPPGERTPEKNSLHRAQLSKYGQGFEHVPPPEREVVKMRADVRRALAYMVTHPRRELALVPTRLRFLYEHGHAAYKWGVFRDPEGRGSRPYLSEAWDRMVIAAADLHFFAVLGMALLGLPAAFSRARPLAAVLPLVWVYFTLLHSVLFFGNPRFHAPLVPFLTILASLPVLAAGGRLRKRLIPRLVSSRRGDRGREGSGGSSVFGHERPRS